MKRFFLTVAILFVALISTTTLSARELNVVPEPAYVDLEAEGEYVVTEKTRIIVVDDMWAPAARFTEDMMSYFGTDKPMRTSKHGNKGIKVRLDSFVPAEGYEMTINDEGIRIINRTSRNLDKPTDVLSFPMFSFEPGNPPCDWIDYQDPATGRCPLGDMCISLERAVAQAQAFGHSTRREIGYLTIHSMLHLLGYDHLDEGEQKKQMRTREEAIASSIRKMSRD